MKLHANLTELNRIIRIGAVSYLNTRPLLYGLKHSGLLHDVSLEEEYPSRLADRLLNDEVDVALIPVAVIPAMSEHHIVSEYCIGAENEVASVCIFSDVPLQQVETILLDYQSRTSVSLARILLRDHWKKNVKFVAAGKHFESCIEGTTAAVIIGDRALRQRAKSPYIYDLALAWKEMTGLPFVFAAWVSNKELPTEFLQAFDRANAYGLAHLDEVIRQEQVDFYDLRTYYTQNISYLLTRQKREALELFLLLVRSLEKMPVV